MRAVCLAAVVVLMPAVLLAAVAVAMYAQYFGGYSAQPQRVAARWLRRAFP